MRWYKLQYENTLLLVNATVRLAHLSFAGSRGGPQRRQLRSGGIELLGDDEHYTIMDHLNSL